MKYYGIGMTLFGFVTATSQADPIQWRIEDGGNGHWYMVEEYGLHDSWSAAQASALAQGGHLATVTSSEENSFVTSLYSSVGDSGSCDSCSSGSAALLGGMQDAKGGWSWVTGESWDFEDWYPGEPNSLDETVLYLRCPGQWNDGGDVLDTPCRYAAIIEWEPTQWRVEDGGNGHWYEAVSVPSGISWLDANTAASERGGYLATLTSADEDQFVCFTIANPEALWNWDGTVARGPWLGGQRTEENCDLNVMNWVTGEPWDYTRWHSGNPNDDCTSGLQLWDYGGRNWQDNHDDDPTRANGFIVEYTTLPGSALGACCLDGLCITTAVADCNGNSGSWGGPDSSCADFECPEICPADLDGDGIVKVHDLLILIAAWGTCP